MRTQCLGDIAKQLVRLHGLRAQALALERASEMRLRGDTAGHAKWQSIHGLICERKRTGRRPEEEPEIGPRHWA